MGEFQFQDLVIYHYVLSDAMLLNNTKPEYFQNSILRSLFTIAKEHAIKYAIPPTQQEVKNIVQLKCVGDELTNDIIESVYNSCDLSSYSMEWLRDNSAKWVKVHNLEYVMRKATAYMKTSNFNSDNAEEVVENVKSMISNETAIDFDTSAGVDFFNAESHTSSELVKHSTGYDYIDKCLKGGFYLGGLFTFLAGPKCGKSFWLCNLAAQSVRLGFNTLYVTLELAEGMVNKRMSANLMDMTMSEYSHKCKDVDYIRSKINSIKSNNVVPMGALRIKQFPTSTLSAQALAVFVKKQEEQLGIKFKNIFVDYINIMQNAKNPNSENTYLKIKTIAEDLRGLSITNQWTIITVTQTNREGWDTSDLTTKDIAESGGLLHTVDGLFGIITNPEMKANGEYYLKSMAMRDGDLENTRKHFLINWHKGKIDEDMSAKIEDCSMTNVLNNHNGKGRNVNSHNNQRQHATQQVQQTQQQLPEPPKQSYKPNTHFKKNAKLGMLFKCVLSPTKQGMPYFTNGEKLFMTSPSDNKKMVVVKYTGESLDSNPMFEILKFFVGDDDSNTVANLGDIFVEDKANVVRMDGNKDVLYGTCEHPFDIKEPMLQDNTPQYTNAFTNDKQLLGSSPMGIDLDSISGHGLFAIDLTNN